MENRRDGLERLITLCYLESMRKWVWIAALAVLFAATSHAQMSRQLPANGKLGDLTGPQPFPLVQIDSKVMRLAPGARIYNEDNRIIVHSYLPQQARVYFVQDAMNGDILRIYLLRPSELESLQRAR